MCKYNSKINQSTIAQMAEWATWNLKVLGSIHIWIQWDFASKYTDVFVLYIYGWWPSHLIWLYAFTLMTKGYATRIQGWDSPTLKLYYLSLQQALFQWKTTLVEKTVKVELSESWPRSIQLLYLISYVIYGLSAVCCKATDYNTLLCNLAKRLILWK